MAGDDRCGVEGLANVDVMDQNTESGVFNLGQGRINGMSLSNLRVLVIIRVCVRKREICAIQYAPDGPRECLGVLKRVAGGNQVLLQEGRSVQ